jgi:hypothetical protein
MTRKCLASSFTLLLVACGSSHGGSAGRDAGGGVDAGPMMLDGGPGRVDGGPVDIDAGGDRTDAGGPVDAGMRRDATVVRTYDIPEAGSYRYLCDLPVPEGAQAPDALPTYAGTCPTIGLGAAGRNTISSGGADRQFIVVAPPDIMPGERLPVVFLWHHMGSEADTFLNMGFLEADVAMSRFIAVLPESKDDLVFEIPFVGRDLGWEWPWTRDEMDARIEEELRFFDDMLACVAAQFPVNEQCVSTGGVSAGGLWQPVFAARRSNRLASIMSMSGGVDGASTLLDFFAAGPWEGAEHRLPALVVWGGPMDTCLGFNFEQASMNLEASLEADGHAIVECIHNCTHSVPPFDPEQPLHQLVDFVMNHPYWLADGDTPYLWSGLPDSYPEWCGIGRGSATIRTGECLTDNPCERIPGL